MLPAFFSDPADLDDRWGWIAISDSLEMTKLPIYDGKNNVFARLGARRAKDYLATIGALLPTVPQWDAFKAIALHIEPYPLPDAAMTLDAGVALHDQEAIEAYRVQHMMTLEWAKIHDAEVFRRASAAGWDPFNPTPIDNCGKHWALPDAAHPARPNHSLIYGWWTPYARRFGVHNDVMIQPASDFHDDVYDDDGTTFHGVRPRQS